MSEADAEDGLFSHGHSNIIITEWMRHNFVFLYSPPEFPQNKRGANGKFLPKPLLFHLRHPNSKTNQPKFWQILSPKNSFAKTSSALFRHLPEYLEGRTPKKNVLSTFKRNFTPAKSRKQGVFFFRGCRGFARQFQVTTRSERATSFVLEIGSSLVQ